MENTINVQSSITQSEPSNEKDCSKKFSFKYKMLGVVTLYNPNVSEAAENIMRYAPWLDMLIIWDNSPLEHNVKQQILPLLESIATKILWHGTGENLCIAPAINFAWHYAQENVFEFLLIMDQDSQWDNFAAYRRKVEELWIVNKQLVFCPYVTMPKTTQAAEDITYPRTFINSGTIFPTTILTAVGGADEAFPLDALDHELSIRIQKAGYRIACLNRFVLQHHLGSPSRSKWLPVTTLNYNSFRTYSILRGYILLFRKHWSWFTLKEKYIILRGILFARLLKIIFIEEDKWGKTKSLFRAIKDGLLYKL